MAEFKPEEWTQDGDVIWCGYLNKNMTHAMLAHFWSNDEATDAEAANFVLHVCQSHKSMLALLEKALPIIEAEADRREIHSLDSLEDYWVEMRNLVDEISAEIDRAKGKGAYDG